MILSSFFVCIVNMLTIHTMLTRKKSIVYCLVTYLINTVFVFTGAFLAQKHITDPTILIYLSSFIAFIYIVYIHIIFKESIAKKIFAMFSIWMFSTITLFLVNSIVDILLGTVNAKYSSTLIYILRVFLQVFLLLATYFWLSKPYKRILNIVADRTINFMSLYPIIAYLLLINKFTLSLGQYRNFNSKYDALLFLVFISLGYILVFAGISSSSKIVSLQFNYKIIENQVELQRQNYKTVNESIDKLYELKHDVRHHVSAIETMVRERKYEQALEYIEQFNKNEILETLPILCNNFAADSIIKYYMSLAISKNIKFKHNINIPEDIGINPLDLCVVLGNSLENAIEACDKLSIGTKKYIELVTKLIDNHIVFRITNNFNCSIVKIDNIIKSSKQEPSHGIGLSNICETVKKYNGNVDIKCSGDEFEITIIMCKNFDPTQRTKQ